MLALHLDDLPLSHVNMPPPRDDCTDWTVEPLTSPGSVACFLYPQVNWVAALCTACLRSPAQQDKVFSRGRGRGGGSQKWKYEIGEGNLPVKGYGGGKN
jgi:hypothetical protein